MKTLVGNENNRVIHFGKRHRVAVTFTRVDGLWRAHTALLPRPHRNIRVARQMVASRLVNIATAERMRSAADAVRENEQAPSEETT